MLDGWRVESRVVVERERESSSRMMDYNSHQNSPTFSKAQQKFGLSLGLSNLNKHNLKLTKSNSYMACQPGPSMAKTWPNNGPKYLLLHGYDLLTLQDI